MLGSTKKTCTQSEKERDARGNHQVEGSHKGYLLHKENKKELKKRKKKKERKDCIKLKKKKKKNLCRGRDKHGEVQFHLQKEPLGPFVMLLGVTVYTYLSVSRNCSALF